MKKNFLFQISANHIWDNPGGLQFEWPNSTKGTQRFPESRPPSAFTFSFQETLIQGKPITEQWY